MSFNKLVEQMLNNLGWSWFSFFSSSLIEESFAGTKGGQHASLWTAPQLAPVASLGLPHAIEELTLHSFPLPFILVKSQYDPIFKFITTYATDALGKAEALGIDRNDAANNLLFFLSFNAFGGFNIFFPAVVKEIGENLITPISWQSLPHLSSLKGELCSLV